jgi:hypothetical protein
MQWGGQRTNLGFSRFGLLFKAQLGSNQSVGIVERGKDALRW